MAPRLKRYDDSRCTVALRSTLVFGNLIICLLSLAVIAVGIYLIWEKIYFFQFVYGTELAAASCYLIISAGVITFLISFIGCYGTLFNNGKLMLIYCFVLLVVFMASVLGATIAIVCRVWIYDLVKIYMQESLMSVYGTNMQNPYHNLVTRCWDETQEKFECCGVENQGWARYRMTFWYRDLPGEQEVDKPYVPFSCCKKVRDKYLDQFRCQYNLNGPPGMTNGPTNPALFYTGCFDAGLKAMYKIVTYFIIVGFVWAALMIGGIVCSLVLYLRKKK